MDVALINLSTYPQPKRHISTSFQAIFMPLKIFCFIASNHKNVSKGVDKNN